MDSLQVVVVASPFVNLTSLYEVDPDADVLLIVPPRSSSAIAPCDLLGVKPKQTSTAPPKPGVRIKVSSKHLALASKVLKTKLFGSGKLPKQPDGRVHLQLSEGFDSQAVTIIMNAIHGRGPRVPKSVDLDLLAQLALVVDKFQFYDALEVYADRWISRLAHTLPQSYNRDLILWIYISYVFRNEDIFASMTKIAALQSSRPIQTLGFPIRDKIVQSIDGSRQALLSRTLATLYQSLEELASGGLKPASCSHHGTHDCGDSLLLGELVKSLHRQHISLWQKPSAPFTGLSYASVAEGVVSGLELYQQRQRVEDSEVLSTTARPSTASSSTSTRQVQTVWSQSEPKKEHVIKEDLPEWKKKKKHLASKSNANPAWGIINLPSVGPRLPPTPAASPELTYTKVAGLPDLPGAGAGLQADCWVRRVTGKLEGVEQLGREVEGLRLVSKLGYLAF